MTFTPEILTQSAGVASRERKLLGEVIHPAAPAGAERGAAKGTGGIKTAPTSEYVAGTGLKFPHTTRARWGLVPDIFARDRRGPPQLGRKGVGATGEPLGSPNYSFKVSTPFLM